MEQSTQSNTCPTCKSPIPIDAPGGLCPACTLEKAATVAPTGTGGRRSAPPAIEKIAPHFPDLEILELIGAGGMGAVYKARQPQLDRTVALKILSHELARDPAFVERFNREAKTLARLSHPNIVAVFDFGTAGPYCYLLMEHVDGVNLRQAMRTGGFKPAEALALVQEVCAALQFAHEEGILHRDIKPENILIDSKGRVKIADFGIAKLVGDGAASDVTLTLQGSILGSPHYMAPEQIETPGDVDQRADIYSLGVVLYEMLTGELPIGRFALPSEKGGIDQRIDEIVLRTLAKERQARFQTAQDVGTQVAAVTTSPEARAPMAPSASSPDPEWAGFSLTSALLTAFSLVGSLVLLGYSRYMPPVPDSEAVSRWLVLVLLGFVLVVGPALLGFFLGIRALLEIRSSEGRKGGLGFAIFAAVAWPIGCMAVLILFSLYMVPSSGGRALMVPFVAILITAIPLLLASFVLIRGLRRWARGVERKDGQRHFPGLAGTMLATLGLTLLGPVLVAVSPYLLGPSDDAIGQNRMARERALSSSGSSYSDKMDWHRGAPEVTLPVQIHDSFRAEFRLALYDGELNVQKYAEVGAWEPIQRRKNIKIVEFETCRIKIGTTPTNRADGNRDITALITGNGKSGTLTTDTDFAEWDFYLPEQRGSSVPLATAGSYGWNLAKRKETIDGESKLTGVLRLEVELIER